MPTDIDPVLASLRIDRSGVPIYLQLRDQLLHAIGDGRLSPDQRLPTMREVATFLSVDLNTVRRAYDALARTGAIRVVPARGTFVAERPPAPDKSVRNQALDAFAHRVIALAHAAGLDPAAAAKRVLQIQKGDER
jgi:GntR family transcriptional regulator